MFPSFTLFEREISLYGIMTVIGALACMIYYNICKKRRDIPSADAELALIFSVIGIFIGAKLLYLLTILPDIIADWSRLFVESLTFLQDYLGSGFVFYGGFYGGVVTCIIYAKVTKQNIWDFARSFTPMVPLFHVFGRIGCFLAGCCYGIENETFGVIFRNSTVAPNDIPLLPVQLYESLGELWLFVITAKITSRPNSGPRAFSFWIIAYGIMRFLLEFLRGDDYRGFIGIFSVSQVIALASIVFGIVIAIRKRERNSVVSKSESFSP